MILFKRTLALLLALAMVAGLFPSQVFAQQIDMETEPVAEESMAATEVCEVTAAVAPEEKYAPTLPVVEDHEEGQTVYATSGTFSGGQTWSFDEITGVITFSGTGALPDYSDYTDVPWDSLRESISGVVFQEGITNIPNNAFYDCQNLVNVSIPSTVTAIGKQAFQFCAFTSFTIPDTVTSLGTGVFIGCRNLEEVIIPASVRYIPSNCFNGCNSLKSIEIPAGITGVGSYAFSYTGLKKVELPASVTDISEGAFSYCTELTDITMSGVQTLGFKAFYGCESLEKITIPASMRKIANSVFDNSGLQEIHIEDLMSYCTNTVCYSTSGHGNSTTYSSNKLFQPNRKLYTNGQLVTDLVIPDGTTSIMLYAFASCTTIKSVTIPKSVKRVGQGAFSGCKEITKVEMETGIEDIGEDAFLGCSKLTDLQLPHSGKIHAGAFYDCNSLKEVEVPDGVTYLGARAFYCSGLEKLTIGATVTTLSERIKYSSEYSGAVYCPNLKELHLGNLSAWACTDFGIGDNGYTDVDLYVNGELVTELVIPENISTIGKNAFSDIASITAIVGNENLTAIQQDAFAGCVNLRTIRNANKVTFIGDGAFACCPELKSMDVLESVITIGAQAFFECASLTSVEIPKTLTTIDIRAFERCTGLEEVKLEEGLTRIGNCMFSQCTNLKSIKIPNSVTSIGYYAFLDCSNLSKVKLPVKDPYIDSAAFSGTGFTYFDCPPSKGSLLSHCQKLESASVQNGVSTIGSNYFDNCINLREVYIPATVTSIGWAAFRDCNSLTDVYYGGSASDWAAITVEDENEILKNVTVHFANKGFSRGSGTCGKSMTWEYFSGGELIFYGSGDMYSYTPEDLPWGEFVDYISTVKMADKINSISPGAFANCARVKEIRLSRSLGEIPASAFQNCVSLEKVAMFKGVKTIGQLAFCGCSSLALIDIPETVTTIDNFAFAQCTALASIRIPDGVVSIGNNCLRECTGLKHVILSAGLRQIGMEVFDGCAGLEAVFFLGNSPEFANSTFYGNEIIAYYPANNDTWTEAVRQNYGGTVGWIAYDPKTTDVSSDAQILKKMSENVLIITPRPASQFHNEAARQTLMKIGVDMSSVLGVTAAVDGRFYIPQSEAKRKEIQLTKEGYQTYVVPREVSASLMPVYSDGNNAALRFPCELDAYMSLDKKDGMPYVSTVFARPSGANAPYQDVRFQELKMYEGNTFDVIISVVGLEYFDATYYIGQSEANRISSNNGVFSGEDLFAQFEADKPVYAYVIRSDGRVTEAVQIKLTKEVEKDNGLTEFLESETISIFGKDGQGITIPDDVWCIGGMEMDVAAFTFPVGIDVTGSDVKISLGLDLFKGKKELADDTYAKKTLFENYKSSVKKFWETDANKSAEDALATYKRFAHLFDESAENYFNKSKNWNIGVMGYLEGTIVNSNLIVKDAYLGINGGFTIKYTQQGAVGVVPAYFYTNGGAKVNLGTKFFRFVPDSDVPLSPGLILDITPEIRVGGGVGVKNAASAGLWASGSLPFHRNFNTDYTRIKLQLEAGVEAEFFILKGEKAFPENIDMIVYESNGIGEYMPVLFSDGHAKSDETEVSVVSRDYAKDTSQWLGGQSGVMLLEDAGSAVTFRDLQTGVYANSMAQIAAFGDGLIMVWVEDDASRDAYNRMRLVCSVYDAASGTWSEAMPVYDDGHNDGYPSLVSDGDTAYVVWQKIDVTLNEDNSTYDTLLGNSELCIATIDAETGSVVDARKITDNDEYEYNAVVTVLEGEPAIYHASVAATRISNSGAHSIMRRSSNLDWAGVNLVEGLNNIISLDAADGNVSYSMDTDGLDGTTNDINVFTYYDADHYSDEFDKAGNVGAYTVAVYGNMDGTKTLFVSDMENIYYSKENETKAVFDMPRSISGNINAVNTDKGTVLLWTENVDDRTELFAVSYSDGVWSKPIRISDQDHMLYGVDAAVYNGKLVGVCNAAILKYTSPTGAPSTDKSNLCFFGVEDATDLSLSRTVIFDESTVVPGSECSFEVFVKNSGSKTVKNVEFLVTDTLGTEYTVTKSLNLLSGDSMAVSLEYPVPENFTATTLTVAAVVPGEEDVNSGDNTVSISIGKPNLLITDAAVYSFDDGYIIKAVANNASAVDAGNVTISILLDEEDAQPIYIQQIGTLGRDSYVSADITVGMDQLTFDENDAAKVYLKVESDAEDAVESDNISCIVLTKPLEIPCGHLDTEVLEGYAPSCEGTGLTDGSRCYDCGDIVLPQENVDALGHEWQDATCTDPEICENCGMTRGEPLGHASGEPQFTWNDQYEATAKFTCSRDSEHTYEVDAEVTSQFVAGNCKTKDVTKYTATATWENKEYTVSKSVEGELGQCSDKEKNHECNVCGNPVGEHKDTDEDHKCDYGCEKAIGTCEDKNNDGKCDYGCGKEFEVKPTEPKPTEPVPTEPQAPKVEGVTRLAGADRIVTSFLVADQLKTQMGIEKFDSIIVASGKTFADALPGSYLAAVKNAPILLTLPKDKFVAQTAEYIKANLKAGGTVYILGGTSAVPASMETAVGEFNVQRVAGEDRFGTNLAILKVAGVKAGDEILVCTAREFADSLSAAATGKPILLVYKKLTDAQKAYLATLSGNTFCVVGGTSAVPTSFENELGGYGSVSRLAGKDRLDTSVLVAKKYFPNATTSVVAYGWDFPDGLCGGSLAYATKSPLILAHSKEKLFKFTADYTVGAGLKAGYVLGGDKLVDDTATRAIFGMGSESINILK